MIFGMTVLTFFHVLLSLVGLVSGFVVVFGLLAAKELDGWAAVFLSTTVLTSVTGFLFPFHRFLPSYGVGLVSLLVLALAIYALYVRKLHGPWRRVYVVTAVIAQYLNFFVLIAQLFQKVPTLRALAPTQTEAPFKLAQLGALVLFVLLATMAAIKSRVDSLHTV
jgi:hypothetical protein